MIDIYTSLGGYRMTWLSSVVTALFIIVVTYAVVALYREIAQGESVLRIILLLGGLLITSLTTY